MKVSPEILQNIRDKVPITEVVGEHVVLRKSGANWVGLCTFHAERSPSFSVSETKGLYHCYGCKKGGDLFSFVMEILGISFGEAMEELAERAKVKLPDSVQRSSDGVTQATEAGGPAEGTSLARERREREGLAYKLNRFVAGYYHRNLGVTLARGGTGLDYFAIRGVGAEEVRSFYLGVALDFWEGLSQFLKDSGAPLSLAIELGLVRDRPKGAMDSFRNRAIFPIVNLKGKIAGFGGRLLESESTAKGAVSAPDAPKYLNSPESFIYQKGKLLYGLYQAQKYIREADEAVLVEGYFDVLAMHRAGFKNSVATCGTALTRDHLSLLGRFASRVTVLFDGDSAGQLATIKAMELGLQQGVILFGAMLPSGKDPDELILDSKGSGGMDPEGVAELKQILKSAQPILDRQIEQALGEGEVASSNQMEARIQGLKKVSGWLSALSDPVGREVRLRAIEKRLGLGREVLNRAMKDSSKGGAVSKDLLSLGELGRLGQGRMESPKRGSVGPPKKLDEFDRMLLSALVTGRGYTAQILKAISELPQEIGESAGLSALSLDPRVRKVLASVRLVESGADEVALKSSLEEGASVLIRAGLPEGTNLAEKLISVLNFSMEEPVVSVLTEAFLSDGPLFSEEEFHFALLKRLVQLWARFSHELRQLIAAAESKQDTALQSRLLKEYLDVQRKMKDFNNFYDQK